MKNLDFIKVIKKENIVESKIERLNKSGIKTLKSNKTIIALFTISFLYLCYLSIPALYNDKIIKTKLKNEISSIFNSEFVEFEKYSYTFFPRPHFNIKKIVINNNKNKDLKIADIKNLNLYISQKNFFKKNNFEITLIKLTNANINFDKNTFNNFNNFFSKLIKNDIKIINSKLFLNDSNNKTYSMVNIDKLNLFFEEKKNNNKAILTGNIFNLPFKLDYKTNPYNNEGNLKINFSKIKLNFENISKSTKYYSSVNEIGFLNSKFITEINNKKNKNIYELTSKDSNINQSEFKYSGNFNLKPFYFDFLFKVKNVNLFKFVFFNKIFENIIYNFFLNNSHLNGVIQIELSDIKKNKYFEEGKIYLNIKRGKFDLSGSEFTFKNIGKIKILSNQFFNIDDKVNFQLNTKFEINNQEKLYKKFLIPKKNRFNIKNIYFLMDVYPSLNEIIFSNFEINEKDNNFYQNSNFTVNSWQDLRNMLNKLLINYEG